MKILGRIEVMELTGLHSQQLTRLLEKGKFPKPVVVLRATSVWRESDVRRWMKRR